MAFPGIILIETSSWDIQFFLEPPQLIRDSHYMVFLQTFPYRIPYFFSKSFFYFVVYKCMQYYTLAVPLHFCAGVQQLLHQRKRKLQVLMIGIEFFNIE